MTTSSVASLRPSPTMAVYGLACVFLYLIPAIVFLLPTSLVSAELASGWEGGVYNWVALGISKPMGFLAVGVDRVSAARLLRQPGAVTHQPVSSSTYAASCQRFEHSCDGGSLTLR